MNKSITYVILCMLTAISVIIFFIEYKKQPFLFETEIKGVNAELQPQDYFQKCLVDFGLAKNELNKPPYLKKVCSFKNSKGTSTTISISKLLFTEDSILNADPLNKYLDKKGYTILASPNEFYECDLSGNYLYKYICHGCNLKQYEDTLHTMPKKEIQLYENTGKYKNFGVKWILNAVVARNYDTSVLQYNETQTQIRMVAIRELVRQTILDSSARQVIPSYSSKRDSIIRIANNYLKIIIEERKKNLEQIFNNIFDSLNTNSMSKTIADNNLVIPAIGTGGSALSDDEFYKILFEILLSRNKSNSHLPKEIILNIYSLQENEKIDATRTALVKSLYAFYSGLKDKKVNNEEVLSFHSKLIGTLMGTMLFVVFISLGIFKIDPLHFEIVRKNWLLFSFVILFSALGISSLVSNYAGFYNSFENFLKYIFEVLIGFVCVFIQYVLYKTKDIREIFK